MKYIYDNIYNYNNIEYKKMYALIKPNKQKHIKNILKIDDKKRSILGEYLLIKLLDSYNINYDKINICINNNGKPYIENKNIFFNISHSHNYVVCVISNKPIGIDIEKIRTISKNTIKYYSNKKELDYIYNNDKLIYNRAFIIYTLKEAYCKCLGKSIINIKNFNIYKDNNITFKLIYDIDNYIIAIAKKK